MFNFFFSNSSIGLELSPKGIKGAKIVPQGKSHSLTFFSIEGEGDVKPLYIHHPIITTGLSGKEVIVRSLKMPLVKDKDIEEALPFQAEPLLPYSSDQAFLGYQILNKSAEESEITLLSAKKEAVQNHIDQWQTYKIEPEKISCIPSALCEFGKNYFISEHPYIILHIQPYEMSGILLKDKKLYASFALSCGYEPLLTALEAEGKNPEKMEIEDWTNSNSSIGQAFLKLQKEVAKMCFALMKELRGDATGIAITGDTAQWENFARLLSHHIHLPLIPCEPNKDYSEKEILQNGAAIGLALGSLPSKPSIDFRQQELSYPHPWKRLFKPLATYFLGVFLLSFSFYFFGQQYLHLKEDQLKLSYLDLLGGVRKSHEQFELSFLTKNLKQQEPFDSSQLPKIETLNQEDISNRLAFLQKELRGTPDSFPLFANIPRVSDFLAWLSQHEAIAFKDENDQRQTKLQIDNLSYTMIKRPENGKKQDKYQVKVEFEFTSPTPKWAREFHDALITPNEWIDPKNEVKWSSNRGKYKTSFFLKDKTTYPQS